MRFALNVYLGLALSQSGLLFAQSAPTIRVVGGDARTGQARAVVVGPAQLVHTGQVFPEASGKSTSPTPPADQIRFAWSRLQTVLKAAEAELADVARLNCYVATPAVAREVEALLATVYTGTHQPTVTFVTTPLRSPETLIAFDAVAVSHRKAEDRVVPFVLPNSTTQSAIASVMPEGSRIYISGQAEAGDKTMADATAKTMASLFASLEFLGRKPADVAHVKAFLGPMTEANAAVAAIRAAFGEANTPPISLVAWNSSLPIEIEMVVSGPNAPDKPALEFLTPPGMSKPDVYSRVTVVNAPGTIFTSSLFVAQADAAAEARGVFEQLKSVVESAGGDLGHLAKGTYYVSSDEASEQFNAVRPEFYDPERPPAASKAMVLGTGHDGVRISIDLIATPVP